MILVYLATTTAVASTTANCSELEEELKDLLWRLDRRKICKVCTVLEKEVSYVKEDYENIVAELKMKDEELDRKEGEIKEYTEMKMDVILIKERWKSIVKYLQEKNKEALLKEQEKNKNLQDRIDRQCKMII